MHFLAVGKRLLKKQFHEPNCPPVGTSPLSAVKVIAPICSVFNVHVREHASSQTCTTLPKMLTGKTYQQKKMVLLKPTKVDVHPEISVTKRVLTYPLSDRDEALLKNTQSPFGHLLSNPHYEKNTIPFVLFLSLLHDFDRKNFGGS